MNEFEKKIHSCELMQSCEDEKTMYLCDGDVRYIFREGKCIGWYLP